MATLSGSMGRGPSIIGKLFLTLFLSGFLGMGLWLTHLMVQGFVSQFETYSWPQVTCTVLSSHVEENPGAPEPGKAYIFRVRYRWATDGAAGTSDVYRSSYSGSSDIGEALRLTREYSAGADVPCWVNPERADSALLELQSPWNVFLIFFPLIFVAVGAGGIWLVWRRSRFRPARIRTSISSRASGKQFGPGCLAGFFSVFLLAGLGIFVPFFLIPAYDTWSAGHWQQVPCTLEYSAVRTHTGDDSSTYSLDVLYSYEVNGVRYKSSRYDFFTGSDSDYDSKRAFVDEHPAGTSTTCFVDPNEPLNAVINRDYAGHFLWALLPLVFVLVGGIGIAWSLSAGSTARRAQRTSLDFSGARGSDAVAQNRKGYSFGPRVLKPAASPLGRLIGGIIFAAIWNGITGIFVWLAVDEWTSGGEVGCLTIFLIPFVLIGILMLLNIPYQILALFNPRPEMTLDSHDLALGRDVSLGWSFRGAAGRIRRLRITLEGTEKVTYRRGTDTHRDSHTFSTIDIVDRTSPERLQEGRVSLRIPADSMHSFEASNNQIVWILKLHAEIRVWPDVSEEFEIQVEPEDQV